MHVSKDKESRYGLQRYLNQNIQSENINFQVYDLDFKVTEPDGAVGV